jgi:hypothetical protein
MPSAVKVSLEVALNRAITLLYTHGCLTEAQRRAAREKLANVKDGAAVEISVPRSGEFALKLCSGPTGESVYLNDYRIAGPKPYGGGRVTKQWVVHPKDIANAVR